MRTFKGAKVAMLTAGLAVWAVLTYACSADDENPGNAPRTKNDGGGDGTVDPQAQNDAPLTGTLCAKYGGFDKWKTIADGVISRASLDCRLSPAFANAAADNLEHLRECFEQQLAGSTQVSCPGVSYVAGTTKDAKGKPCRDMTQAHQNLPGGKKIRLADYNAFVELANAEFGAQGITDKTDLVTLATFFEGTKGNVVQAPGLTNSFCDSTCATCKPTILDAGLDTGIDSGTDSGIADASDGG
jgi:hypothetical protein